MNFEMIGLKTKMCEKSLVSCQGFPGVFAKTLCVWLAES